MKAIVTHQEIRGDLCGNAVKVEENYALVELRTSAEMAVDTKGLVHGGFIFGLADYAAMIAVNDPHVVLGAAQVMFKKPVKLGETAVAEAHVIESKNNKRIVEVSVKKGAVEVFQGTFTCFILEQHVLD